MVSNHDENPNEPNDWEEQQIPLKDVVLSNSWALQAILNYLEETNPGARDRIWQLYCQMKDMSENANGANGQDTVEFTEFDEFGEFDESELDEIEDYDNRLDDDEDPEIPIVN